MGASVGIPSSIDGCEVETPGNKVGMKVGEAVGEGDGGSVENASIGD